MKEPRFFNRKDYHGINTIGLAIGIACVLVIMLWIEDELKFDTYNKNVNRIYRILAQDEGREGFHKSAMTMPPLAEALKEKLPEVENSTNFESDWQVVVKVGDNYLNEEGLAVVGKNFFDVFSFPLIKGNPQLLDSEKYEVVLSEKTAKKYFGEDDAIGKNIEINKVLVSVAAVFKDIDYNSHIRFDLAIPEELGISLFGRKKGSWANVCLYTYVQVKPNVTTQVLASKLSDFMVKNIDPEKKIKLFPQPLKDIHFQKDLADEDYTNLGDIRYVYIFSFMGLFILLLACINFINLSTAVSEKNINDNRLRKILGASKTELVKASVFKSLLTSTLATAIGFVILYMVLPFINEFTNKNLGYALINPVHILFLISIAFISGILSGLYPAFFLASFSPIKVIKNSKTKSSQWQRKGLIVFQFSLSIFFIIATLVSFKQFNLIRAMNLGFDNKHTIYFYLKTTKSDYQTLREKLLKISGIEMVGGKEYYSPTIMNMANVYLPGEGTKNIKFSENFIDEDFFSLLKVKFADGHNFSKDIKGEWENGVIINHKAKELIGENPLGKVLSIWGRQFNIIGVLDETHFRNVNESDQPEFYVYTYSPRYIFVRYNNNFSLPINHLSDQIKRTIKELYPEAPFDFKFLDVTYARLYENDKRVGAIYAIVAVIAILISCIGLFGLSSFSTENRTKEIGIRKINGARISEILFMLNTDFISLIFIAYIFVVPIAWYSMHKWLQSFIYKTDLNWSIFALAGLLALAIALITVSWQSWRAATRNPVDALRYE